MAGFINNSAASGITKELLWSNSAPTTAYTSGSVTISAADYDFFLIKYKVYRRDTYYFYTSSGKEASALVQVTADEDGAYRQERQFTITDTTITFQKCTYQGSGYYSDNDSAYLIPVALYGLK